MSAEAAGFVIERTVHIDAPPEFTFRFLTEPELLQRWMVVSAEVEVRPGGRCHLNVTGNAVSRGTYEVVDPPRRLIYSWGFDRAGSSRVEIRLQPAAGGTELTLRHSGFSNPQERDSHERGWSHYLQRLAVAAPGGDAGPDPWRDAAEDDAAHTRARQET